VEEGEGVGVGNGSSILLLMRNTSVTNGTSLDASINNDSVDRASKRSSVVDGDASVVICTGDVMIENKPSVSSGVCVGVSSRNGRVSEELKKLSSVTTDWVMVGIAVSMFRENAPVVGGVMDGVGKSAVSTPLTPSAELSREKMVERVRSSSAVGVEGSGEAVMEGVEGEGRRRDGGREETEGKMVVRGSWFSSLVGNGRRKSVLKGVWDGEIERGVETIMLLLIVGVADGNGTRSSVES
jgi:hypothetical protein